MLTFFIVGLLFICALSTSITWERTPHPVRRAFSSDLFSIVNVKIARQQAGTSTATYSFVAASGQHALFYFVKSRAGLSSKKLTGRSSNSCHAVGITGHTEPASSWWMNAVMRRTLRNLRESHKDWRVRDEASDGREAVENSMEKSLMLSTSGTVSGAKALRRGFLFVLGHPGWVIQNVG